MWTAVAGAALSAAGAYGKNKTAKKNYQNQKKALAAAQKKMGNAAIYDTGNWLFKGLVPTQGIPTAALSGNKKSLKNWAKNFGGSVQGDEKSIQNILDNVIPPRPGDDKPAKQKEWDKKWAPVKASVEAQQQQMQQQSEQGNVGEAITKNLLKMAQQPGLAPEERAQIQEAIDRYAQNPYQLGPGYEQAIAANQQILQQPGMQITPEARAALDRMGQAQGLNMSPEARAALDRMGQAQGLSPELRQQLAGLATKGGMDPETMARAAEFARAQGLEGNAALEAIRQYGANPGIDTSQGLGGDVYRMLREAAQGTDAASQGYGDWSSRIRNLNEGPVLQGDTGQQAYAAMSDLLANPGMETNQKGTLGGNLYEQLSQLAATPGRQTDYQYIMEQENAARLARTMQDQIAGSLARGGVSQGSGLAAAANSVAALNAASMSNQSRRDRLAREQANKLQDIQMAMQGATSLEDQRRMDQQLGLQSKLAEEGIYSDRMMAELQGLNASSADQARRMDAATQGLGMYEQFARGDLERAMQAELQNQGLMMNQFQTGANAQLSNEQLIMQQLQAAMGGETTDQQLQMQQLASYLSGQTADQQLQMQQLAAYMGGEGQLYDALLRGTQSGIQNQQMLEQMKLGEHQAAGMDAQNLASWYMGLGNYERGANQDAMNQYLQAMGFTTGLQGQRADLKSQEANLQAPPPAWADIASGVGGALLGGGMTGAFGGGQQQTQAAQPQAGASGYQWWQTPNTNLQTPSAYPQQPQQNWFNTNSQQNQSSSWEMPNYFTPQNK